MAFVRRVEETRVGFGDRILPSGEIEQFAVVTFETREQQIAFELSPGMLAMLAQQVERGEQALRQLRRREARRASRSKSGWRAHSRY
jgi:hypothetical protein